MTNASPTPEDPRAVNAAVERGELTIAEAWNRLRELGRIQRGHNAKGTPELTAPPSKIKRQLSETELTVIRHMQRVHFGMERGASRFIHQIVNETELTDRQRDYLRLLAYKYRRQLGMDDKQAKEFVARMKEFAAPDHS